MTGNKPTITTTIRKTDTSSIGRERRGLTEGLCDPMHRLRARVEGGEGISDISDENNKRAKLPKRPLYVSRTALPGVFS